MADDNTEKQTKTPRFKAEWAWMGLPGLLVIAFFVWTLMQMGGQSSGATLVRMLLGIAAVLLGGGGLALLLHRVKSTPFNEDE